MPRIYVALGTNLGAREENLREAVTRLAPYVRVTRKSPVYETAPWGVTAQPRFLNMVLEGETNLDAPELLRALKEVERKMGRSGGVRYGPRVIDLDILFYDRLIFGSEGLEIPHPRLAERRFVLVPLADLAPDLVHPVLKRTVGELLAELPDVQDVQPYRLAVQ